MPPNPELLPVLNIDAIIPPYVPPIPEILPLETVEWSSDDDFSSSTSSSSSPEEPISQQLNSIYQPIEIPIEQNLRELLVGKP